MIKACIFDLDGVIVDTAKYHYVAWRKMANELGFDFTEEDNEQLKGISRMDSLNLILSWGGLDLSEEKKQALATQKNNWYLEYIDQMKADEVLDGVADLFKELKAKNIKIALGSSSKNARKIIEKIGMLEDFDAIIDGTQTQKGKPDPEVFLRGAAALNVAPGECIVFEDAEKGVQAALAGGFFAVGIGEAAVLGKAHLVLKDLNNVKFDYILAAINQEN